MLTREAFTCTRTVLSSLQTLPHLSLATLYKTYRYTIPYLPLWTPKNNRQLWNLNVYFWNSLDSKVWSEVMLFLISLHFSMNSHTFTTEIFVWLLSTAPDPAANFILVLLVGPFNRGENCDVDGLSNFVHNLTANKRQSQDLNWGSLAPKSLTFATHSGF